jgi:DedD protein
VPARSHRQGEQAGAGWLATLGGALLLLAVGFAMGLLAGTVWEAPDLVMDHLAGRTTELPLAREISADPVEPAEAPKRESHARPLGAREGSPELPSAGAAAEGSPASAARPAPGPEPPPARSEARAPRPEPPVQGGFAIQVGAFGDADSAARLAQKLRARGFSAHVHGGEGAGAASFRVRVGPVASREEATRLASKLKSDLQLPTWILSPDSR